MSVVSERVMNQPHVPTQADIVFALNECIETCTDAERGYAAASADVRDIELKRLLHDRSRQRTEFAIALQATIKAIGSFPENQGTLKGAAHRAWLEVRRALDGGGDRVVLEECLRGERASLETYQRAFKRAPLADMPEQARGSSKRNTLRSKTRWRI
jgi:uncharacterized protein (TIGR02284 family)